MRRTETGSDVARKSAPEESPSPITSTAWVPADSLRMEDWLHMGKRLGSIGRGAAWWIGDWVNYGNTAFGEKYSRAAQITGYDAQSLMNMAYVASRFEPTRRREGLSWSHHAELAALRSDAQDRWLDRAAGSRLSVRGLREELRATQRANEQLDPAQESAESTDQPAQPMQSGDTAITCPNCGFHLAA